MTAPQEGQRELGRTIDCSRGSRWITTFRKLPIIATKTPATTYMNGSGIKLKSGRTAVRERCIDRHCIAFQAPCAPTAHCSLLTAYRLLFFPEHDVFQKCVMSCEAGNCQSGKPIAKAAFENITTNKG